MRIYGFTQIRLRAMITGADPSDGRRVEAKACRRTRSRAPRRAARALEALVEEVVTGIKPPLRRASTDPGPVIGGRRDLPGPARGPYLSG
jgi:hypothetical protein